MKNLILGLIVIHSSFVWAGGYEFRPLMQQQCSIHDPRIREGLTHVLRDFFQKSYYDRSVYYLNGDFNPNTANTSEKDGLRIDSFSLLKQYGSAHCVGVGQYFQRELLKSDSHLPHFQMVPSTERPGSAQPNMPEYPHIALATWCQDGYILVDPAMNISQPVYLEKDKLSNVNLGFRGVWSFRLNLDPSDSIPKIEVTADSEDPTKPWDELKKKNSSYHYVLKENTNPDEAISKPYFFEDKKIMIFRFNFPNEAAYRVTVNLRASRIECTETPPSGEVRQIFTLDFKDYWANPEMLKELIETNRTAENLRISQKDLLERIQKVMSRFYKM